MLSYVYFGTNDLEKATRFYDATLTPLGVRRCITNDPEWDRISAKLSPLAMQLNAKAFEADASKRSWPYLLYGCHGWRQGICTFVGVRAGEICSAGTCAEQLYRAILIPRLLALTYAPAQ